MLLVEACNLLDVEVDWLMNNLSHKFDYFQVPVDAAKLVFSESSDDERVKDFIDNNPDLVTKKDDFVKEIAERFDIETERAQQALKNKKNYINRDSFYKFLLNDLKISRSKVAITIDNKEVNELAYGTLTLLKNQFLLGKEMVRYDAFTKKYKDVYQINQRSCLKP